MRELTISNFKNNSEYTSFEAKSQLWGNDLFVYIDFSKEHDQNQCLEKCIETINKELSWFENNRTYLEDKLIEKNFLSLAEDWASSAEEAEDEEQECYVMEDGEKVFIPLSETDFRTSLKTSSVSINFEESFENPSFNLYLVCKPDYFACHCIDIYINGDKTIKHASLAG